VEDTHRTDQGRRSFLRIVTDEARSLLDEARGIPQLRLEDLRDLPPDKLCQVIPVVLDTIQLSYGQGGVVATYTSAAKSDAGSVVLFPADSDDLEIFNWFDGSHSIGKICEALHTDALTDAHSIYERVVHLFLRLVNQRICAPRNPIF
jgi:hypothetical protein